MQHVQVVHLAILATMVFACLEEAAAVESVSVAGADRADHSVSRLEQLWNASSSEALDAVMNQTTLPAALAFLNSQGSGASSELKALVANALEPASGPRKLQALVASHRFLDARSQAGPNDPNALQQAKVMLTDLIETAMSKLDVEQMRCADYDKEQAALIKTAKDDIGSFNAQAANARSQILSATGVIEQCQGKLAASQKELKKQEAKCAADIAAIQQQLELVRHDLSVMGNIVNSTTCDSASMAFVQCLDAHTGEPYISFREDALRVAATRLGLTSARQALQQSFIAAVQLIRDPVVVNGTRTLPLGAATSDSLASKKKQQAKCTISNETNCFMLREKILGIDAGIKEKEEDLVAHLARTQGECKVAATSIQSEIDNFDTQLSASQTELAAATTKQNEADASSRLKNKQLAQLTKDLEKETRVCNGNIRNFQGEICAIRKIRGEIMLTKGDALYNPSLAVRDCQLSKWMAGPCTTTCGGGVQTLKRQVLAPPTNGGAKCPSLQKEVKCAEEECPVHCELGEWSGWSTCSAECGGGVKSRERNIKVEATNGGDPCGPTSQTQSCGTGSCDKDCELAQWTDWSTCSKMCGTGSEVRRRHIEVPKKGEGTCAKKKADARMQVRQCNKQVCLTAANETTLQCKSKLDVLLLLDASGSLKQNDWDATIATAKMLVHAFKTADVHLGVQIFSGPPRYNVAKQCATNPEGLDAEKDCGIQWIHHLTSDIGAVETALGSAVWLRSFTLTSLALGLAETELAAGRRDAASAVVVITDGRPLSRSRTKAAAKKLRKKARLMWVPVTRYAPLRDIRKWASEPVRENVLSVYDFETLRKPATITEIIADLCPKVG